MLYIALFILPFFYPLNAGIQFADQTSTLQVQNGARTYVGSNGQVVDGTLKHDTGGTIDGTAPAFTSGVIARDGATAVLTGTYDADAGPAILLQGSDRLEAGHNFTVPTLQIAGENNTLAGSPVLSSALNLGENIGLHLDLTAPLNKSIVLDGGTITLDSSLVCANGVSIEGTGTVNLNDNHYCLARYYANKLNSTLTFPDARNVELQGKTPLEGHWTFSGTSILDGKGGTIDLRHGGSITVAAESRLILRDIQIKGINNDNLILAEGDSILELDGTQLELTTTVTKNSGTIEVTGDSLMVMSEYDFYFVDDANLTVDAAILSLSVMSHDELANRGTIRAPRRVYEERVRQNSNITDNIADGNLTILNNGVITEIGESADDDLIGGDLGGEIIINKSRFVSPGEHITISADANLDGTGARLLFARTTEPQFIVKKDVTVTLKNIEFHGLMDSTIKLEEGAQLQFDEGVVFALAQDVDWSNQKITIVGDNTVFNVTSVGARRCLHFNSDPIGHLSHYESDGLRPHEATYLTHLELGTNTVALHNVCLKGLRHISFSTGLIDGISTTGAIALTGSARVDVDLLNVPHHFVTRGLDNSLLLLSDDVRFTGSITYDHFMTSTLQLDALLPTSFYGTPRVHMDAGVLSITSDFAQAYFKSNIHSVELVNQAVDATILGVNGFIAGNKITVSLNPIKQTSAKASLCPGLQLTSSLPAGAIQLDTDLLDTMRSFGKSPAGPRRMNAFTHQQIMRASGYDNMITRAVQLPDPLLTPIINYQSAFSLPEVAGNITLQEPRSGLFTNWQISSSRAANLSLYDGVQVVQANKATTIKSNDIVNVISGTTHSPNTLQLSNDVTINGKLLLDDDAVLLINCVPDGTSPVITFGSDSTLSLGARSTLMFAGQGTVVLPDSFVLDLGTGNSTIQLCDGMQLKLDDGQAVRVKGKGEIIAERGGQLLVENGSSLWCGNAYTDQINIRIKTGASIRVGDAFATEATASSYFSFTHATGSIDFSQGGSLVVANQGVFECNARASTANPGVLTRLDFSCGGLLYVATGGKLVVGDNMINKDGVTLALHGGSISGQGVAGVAGGTLCGRVQNNSVSAIDLTAQTLVRSIVQTMPTLPHATLYINEEGASQVYTKNGAIVTLQTNQVVTDETDAGVIQLRHTLTGRRMSYNADGEKV